MYPAEFDYTEAASFDEAVRLLAEHGDDARVLAGGQSLIPMMHLRLARPELLIDINGIDRGATPVLSDGVIRVPALTRQRVLERSPVIVAHCPLLADAAAHVGNIRVRSRGTLGGNLAHGDPSSELSCAAVALGAVVDVVGPDAARTIPARELFVTHLTTSLGPAEIIRSIEFMRPDPRTGHAFFELARRAGEFAVVNVAALFTFADDVRTCRTVSVSLGGVGERIFDATSVAAEILVGAEPDEGAVREVARRVASRCQPLTDLHGSAEYRRAMAEVFVRRTLAAAVARARESSTDG
jgi:CO/xanthine dehydrogenase FAD-binding subunit